MSAVIAIRMTTGYATVTNRKYLTPTPLLAAPASLGEGLFMGVVMEFMKFI